jgi:hypothetical protein
VSYIQQVDANMPVNKPTQCTTPSIRPHKPDNTCVQDKSSAFRKLLGETLPASGPKANGPLNPRPSGPGVAGEGAGDHKQEVSQSGDRS